MSCSSLFYIYWCQWKMLVICPRLQNPVQSPKTKTYILNEHHMHNRVAYPICICSPARFCTKLTGWVLERGLAHPQENEMSFILKYLLQWLQRTTGRFARYVRNYTSLDDLPLSVFERHSDRLPICRCHWPSKKRKAKTQTPWFAVSCPEKLKSVSRPPGVKNKKAKIKMSDG